MKAKRHRAALALVFALGLAAPAAAQRLDGLNVIATPDHPFGSASARRALEAARRIGAGTVAIVPFLWQPSPTDPGIRRGTDMSDDELRAAIREARALGFSVLVKPHVWVPQSWAGAVEPRSEADWQTWFAGYRTALLRIGEIAASEQADALAIGTELEKTSHRSEWFELIAWARAVFPGTLLYVAHNAEEAELVPVWGQLDAVGVSLYPPLGEDRDRAGRLLAMRAVTKRLDQIATRTNRKVVVGEIGLRSAAGAAAKPWESAEEREAAADPLLQAEVLGDWLSVLRRPSVRGVLVWRWFTDPAAGGPRDTDFTVQGKPAEGVLLCAWTIGCARPAGRDGGVRAVSFIILMLRSGPKARVSKHEPRYRSCRSSSASEEFAAMLRDGRFAPSSARGWKFEAFGIRTDTMPPLGTHSLAKRCGRDTS